MIDFQLMLFTSSSVFEYSIFTSVERKLFWLSNKKKPQVNQAKQIYFTHTNTDIREIISKRQLVNKSVMVSISTGFTQRRQIPGSFLSSQYRMSMVQTSLKLFLYGLVYFSWTSFAWFELFSAKNVKSLVYLDSLQRRVIQIHNNPDMKMKVI